MMKRLIVIALFLTKTFTVFSQQNNIPMSMESLAPNIMVKNVNETLDFYTKILGFNLIDTNPTSGDFEWGFVKLGNVGFMFQEEKSLKNEYPIFNSVSIGGALTFYIRVNHIEDLYKSIKEKVKIIKPMNKTFYGTNEFAIADLNGFVLTFSETP